jgi:xanthine dehydrogenase YagT iron-sulfur-binding subunit
MSKTPKPSLGDAATDKRPSRIEPVPVNLSVNGLARTITVEPRRTLLDALREELALTGTKKACDRGECGACTVHIDGRRALSCMTLAAMQGGKKITTIEGLEQNGMLHPLQLAFIEHDGFQCGFGTSGQIMPGLRSRPGQIGLGSRRVWLRFAITEPGLLPGGSSRGRAEAG